MALRKNYEAVVIGGGPAGCATAIQLAANRHSVLLVERLDFPRFHIGESLLPASNELFDDLGITERLAAAGFVKKRGASFCSEDGTVDGHVDFALAQGVSDPVSYHVSREKFDELLLDLVVDRGVEVLQPWHVSGLRFHDGGASIDLDGPEGRQQSVSAEFVVDCSGQSGLLAKKFGLRRKDPALRNVAIHTRFAGAWRPQPPRDGDIRIVSLGDLGWIWLIPLEDDVTSVGLVLPAALDRELGSLRDPKGLTEYLGTIPALEGVLDRARVCDDFRRDADFSYSTACYSGDRWLLAGDAGSFIDPIFSTGVLIALESGREAARAVGQALRTGSSERPFAAYEERQRKRYDFYHRFVTAFYDPAFRDLFLQPSDRFGLRRSVTTALAGVWRLRLGERLRLLLFFGLVALQRRFTIVPRVHNRPPHPRDETETVETSE